MSVKWPLRFLDAAKGFASWSKDRTKVGAVARDTQSRAILATGYNGLPRGVEDKPERYEQKPEKYLWVGHAEENVVTNAARQILNGSTVSVTHLCCARCARMLINSGVKKIEYGGGQTSMDPREFEIAMEMFEEAGVELLSLET